MSKIYLISEFIFLFLLIPLIIYRYRLKLKYYYVFILLVVFLICLVLLLTENKFNLSALYFFGFSTGVMERILVRFFAGGIILSVLQYQINRKAFFHFPKKHFWMWILVILTYPVISVYPQEIIYRLFIFHRYGVFFEDPVTFILISSIAFAYLHIIFGNYIAPVLTLFGGLMFASTFYDSGSIIMSSIEHALWGDLLLTIGLGKYFYSGAIKKLEFIKGPEDDV